MTREKFDLARLRSLCLPGSIIDGHEYIEIRQALPAPEVPDAVRRYAAWVDDCKGMPDDNDKPEKNLREWISQEWGI